MDRIKQYKTYLNRVFAINKIAVIIFTVLLCALGISIKIINVVNWLFWLCLFLFILFIVSEILIVIAQRKKISVLKVEAYGKEGGSSRKGLFKEIWDDYEYNQFEGYFDDPFSINKVKVDFIDDHNNTIDIVLLYKKHEFIIQFDENSIQIMADEEKDTPKEKILMLKELHNTEEVFFQIRAFISDCTGKC